MNDILHTYRKMLSKKTGAGTSDRLRIAKGSIKKNPYKFRSTCTTCGDDVNA